MSIFFQGDKAIAFHKCPAIETSWRDTIYPCAVEFHNSNGTTDRVFPADKDCICTYGLKLPITDYKGKTLSDMPLAYKAQCYTINDRFYNFYHFESGHSTPMHYFGTWAYGNDNDKQKARGSYYTAWDDKLGVQEVYDTDNILGYYDTSHPSNNQKAYTFSDGIKISGGWVHYFGGGDADDGYRPSKSKIYVDVSGCNDTRILGNIPLKWHNVDQKPTIGYNSSDVSVATIELPSVCREIRHEGVNALHDWLFIVNQDVEIADYLGDEYQFYSVSRPYIACNYPSGHWASKREIVSLGLTFKPTLV